jgi:protein-disulfide isomerase
MVRFLVLLLLAVLSLSPVPAAALPPLSAMLAERTMGDPNAKVTIVEYSSLTCPHCSEFHVETLPKLKEAYVDTGKVRYVFRDFPLDNRAMAASMIARCAPPDRFFGLIDILYRDQQSWARSTDPLRDLKVRAQLAGLSPADVDACLANQELLKGIQDRAAEAQRQSGIDSTPTFLIGERKISGAAPFAEFQSALDQALAASR